MRQFSDWQILTLLLGAAEATVWLSLVAFLGGGLLGLLLTLARVSERRALDLPAAGFIAAVQSVPLLMLIFLCFFGLPLLGLRVSPWLAACASLVLFAAAFLADIWRSAIQAVPRGQWEAGRALGLSFLQVFGLVVAPQALRLAVPPTVGFSVQVVKGTALTSIIGFVELTKAGTMLNNVTFRPFFVFALVALIYFALCFPLSLASRRLERRLARH